MTTCLKILLIKLAQFSFCSQQRGVLVWYIGHKDFQISAMVNIISLLKPLSMVISPTGPRENIGEAPDIWAKINILCTPRVIYGARLSVTPYNAAVCYRLKPLSRSATAELRNPN